MDAKCIREIKLNWYKQSKIAQQKYVHKGWFPTFEKVTLQVGQGTRGEVYDSQRAAEYEADRSATIYKNQSKGRPGILPVQMTGEYRRSMSGYVGTFIATGPFQTTEKAKLKEDNNNYLVLYELSSYTSGSHGYGEWAERPASSASQSVEWKSEIPPALKAQYDAILKGASVVAAGHEEGSYHERWYRGAIAVSISPEQNDALAQINHGHSTTNIQSALYDRSNRFLPVAAKFSYAGWDAMIEEASNALNINLPEGMATEPSWEGDATQPKPEQTPEGYYDKQIEIERARQRKPDEISGD